MRDKRIQRMADDMVQAVQDYRHMLEFDTRQEVRLFDVGRLDMLELILDKFKGLGYTVAVNDSIWEGYHGEREA